VLAPTSLKPKSDVPRHVIPANELLGWDRFLSGMNVASCFDGNWVVDPYPRVLFSTANFHLQDGCIQGGMEIELFKTPAGTSGQGYDATGMTDLDTNIEYPNGKYAPDRAFLVSAVGFNVYVTTSTGERRALDGRDDLCALFQISHTAMWAYNIGGECQLWHHREPIEFWPAGDVLRDVGISSEASLLIQSTAVSMRGIEGLVFLPNIGTNLHLRFARGVNISALTDVREVRVVCFLQGHKLWQLGRRGDR
jgi:hypothetical protein